MKRRPMGLGTKILAGCVAGALVLAQVPSAWAQPRPAPPASKADLAAAKKHYGEGDKKFKAGDYAGAELDYDRVDVGVQEPDTARLGSLGDPAFYAGREPPETSSAGRRQRIGSPAKADRRSTSSRRPV